MPQCVADAVQQRRRIEWLRHEIKHAGLQGGHRHRDVAVAGDDHRRGEGSTQDKMVMKFQAAHPGQAHVNDKTGRPGTLFPCEKFLCGPVAWGLKADGAEENQQGIPHRRIVLDDMDHRITWHRRSTQGRAGGTKSRLPLQPQVTPKIATVRLDDLTTEHEPQSHAFGLPCHERFEKVRRNIRVDTRSIIFDVDLDIADLHDAGG